MKEVDTEEALKFWLDSASAGERVVYYDGLLMRDREMIIYTPSFLQNGHPPKIRTAVFAWRAFMEGLVTLVQRKRANFEYEYIAIKR